jgi:signal transduction histidine kinase
MSLFAKLSLGMVDLGGRLKAMARRIRDIPVKAPPMAEIQEKNRATESMPFSLSNAQWEAARAQRVAAISQLAAMIAHQVGTPLTALSGHMQLLEEDPQVGADARKRLKIVEAQIDRASRVIQDLLTYSRQPEPTRGPVDINGCLHECIALFHPVMERRTVMLTQLMGERVSKVEGNREQLQEAFCHMIENALEAMPYGGQLTIQSQDLKPGSRERLHAWLAVDIADTGHGIASEYREKIFKPFFTTKKAGDGMGLGLAIVHEVIRTHGGQILVESEPGKGSRFRILLPV